MKWKRFLIKQLISWHPRREVESGGRAYTSVGKMINYDNKSYDDDYEDLTEEQLVFCDAYDIKVRGYIRRW